MGRTGGFRIMGRSENARPHQQPRALRAFLRIKDGAKVEKGDELSNWDPYNAVILSEFEGEIEYEAISRRVSLNKRSATDRPATAKGDHRNS